MVGNVQSLTQALFSLDEPWRGRFLSLVANYATKWVWDGQQPTCEEVAAWLETNPPLYRWVRLLLYRWGTPGV
jgi:hypothetical protein